MPRVTPDRLPIATARPRRGWVLAHVVATVALIALPASAATAAVPSSRAASAVSIGSYENTSPSIEYTGDWRTMRSPSDSGDSSRYLNSEGSASLTFTGTAVQWVSRTTESSGIAKVTLDGKEVARIDRYTKETAYQAVVFERSGLSNSVHRIEISWTGRSNAKARDENLLLDRFIVPDVAAPTPPDYVRASMTEGGVIVAWRGAGNPDIDSYRVYQKTSGEFEPIGHVSGNSGAYTTMSVPDNTKIAFAVAAVDASGNESGLSEPAEITTGATLAGSHRAADCPAATITVDDAKSLSKAVDRAGPGDVIRLEPGRYSDQIDVTARGTTMNPIWICGPRSAVIDGGSIGDNHGILVSNSSNLIVTGMTITNALKGVTVRTSDHITVSDTLVERIGFEGIHLRENTTDSVVVGNTIRATGKVNAEFGEGVYIGSSGVNWCSLTKCLPDRSDRNAITANTISNTGSDLIEAKEGTTGGVISENILSGGAGMPEAEAWVKVKGNNWSITWNTGTDSVENGFRLQGSDRDWGLRNLFANNTVNVNGPGYGFSLYEPNGAGTTDTIIACNNTVSGARSGFASVDCTP